MNSGFGDKDKLRDALELATSFKKGGKAGGAPISPRMDSGTFSFREPPPPSRNNVSQPSGTPSVQNRIYSNAGTFSTGPQKTAPRKIPALGSSGKDFLLRKDVPKPSPVNDTVSKPQSKEKQTSGPGDASIQNPKERPPQKIESREGSRENSSTEPRPPHHSTLPKAGPKDPADTKPDNPGLASFLSFAPRGVFSNAPATISRTDKAEKPIVNGPTSTLSPAPTNSKQASCLPKVAPSETVKTSKPVSKEEFASDKPFDRSPKETVQPSSTNEMPDVAKPVGGNQSPPPEVHIAPEARDSKAEPASETAPKTTPKAREALAGTAKLASIVEPVLKQEKELVGPLKSLPNGAIKEKPVAAKTPEPLHLRPQAKDFSPNAGPVSNSSGPLAQFLAPRLINSVQPTLMGVENLQQFIPTGITTGQLVTTTEVSISGGTMTSGECRGTLYMQTPVTIPRAPPQSLGTFVPVAQESAPENRLSSSTVQRKPTKGLAASYWAK